GSCGSTATRTAGWRSTAGSRRPARPACRAGARARGAPAERRLHDGDLPVIFAHVLGVPVEESALQPGPTGAATVAVLAGGARERGDRLRRRRPAGRAGPKRPG